MQLGIIEIIAFPTNFTFGTIYFTSLRLHFLICNVRDFVMGLRIKVKELERIVIITHQTAMAIISTLL